MNQAKHQLDLFKVDTSWFHFFKELVRSGEWAKLSPSAKAIYPVIKTCVNFDHGVAFPSVPTIEELSGLTKPSVIKALKDLEASGHIKSVKKAGRQTIYQLVEKFQAIPHTEQNAAAEVSFHYTPSNIKEATEELRRFIREGFAIEARHITINKLTINIAGRDINQNTLNGVPEDFRRAMLGEDASS